MPEGTFSNELAEFVSLCLNKNESKRPSANDLLKHHWLRKHRPHGLTWQDVPIGSARARRLCSVSAPRGGLGGLGVTTRPEGERVLGCPASALGALELN